MRNKIISLVILTSCFLGLPILTQAAAVTTPQIGLNFIRFFWENPKQTNAQIYQPETIFKDFEDLGVQVYRQFVKADLLWDVVEPEDGQWNFTAADAVLKGGYKADPIVGLFAMQYASPNAPWKTAADTFSNTLTPEAIDYVTTVVDRYKDQVKYWEIGNEMEHWRSVENGTMDPRVTDKVPALLPPDTFTPEEQGVFLKSVAELIKQLDPDAVIVLPGMAGLDDYSLQDWLGGVIQSSGSTDWFDVVNYHYYSSWESFNLKRQNLSQALEDYKISDKPVWLTETGSTNDASLKLRTDYPNSSETQAADVVRRLIQAYAAGDSLVIWHCYMGNDGESDWRYYGLRDGSGKVEQAYTTFKFFAKNLMPFESISIITQDPKGQNIYKLTKSTGEIYYLAWGNGSYTVPENIRQYTSVVTKQKDFSWQMIDPGEMLNLTAVPILLTSKSEPTAVSNSNTNSVQQISTEDGKGQERVIIIILICIICVLVLGMIAYLLFKQFKK